MAAPRAVYLTSATIYPFILLTAITSLAFNLSYARQSNHQKTQALTAQITVLTDILGTLAATPLPPSGPLRAAQLDAIQKNLEMVGLREGGKAPAKEGTTWREVLLGKKGKEFTQNDEEEPDWETSTFLCSSYVAPSQSFRHVQSTKKLPKRIKLRWIDRSDRRLSRRQQRNRRPSMQPFIKPLRPSRHSLRTCSRLWSVAVCHRGCKCTRGRAEETKKVVDC